MPIKPMLKLSVAAALLSSAALTLQAQDAGALVDKLVKKGVLSSQEGEEVRADMIGRVTRLSTIL